MSLGMYPPREVARNFRERHHLNGIGSKFYQVGKALNCCFQRAGFTTWLIVERADVYFVDDELIPRWHSETAVLIPVECRRIDNDCPACGALDIAAVWIVASK